MLNSCVRPSEVARRIAVEHVNVSPMTVDMEEETTGGDVCKIN